MCTAQAEPSPMTWVRPTLRPFDLSVAGFASQMGGHLVDVGDAGGAERVALGQQPARHVDRDLPVPPRAPLVDQLARAPRAHRPRLS